MPHKYRVAITGIGLVTPIGNDTKATWNNLLKGQSGLSFFDHPDLKDYPYKNVGLVKNEQELLDKVFSANNQRKSDRFIHLAILAGHQAMQDSVVTKEFPQKREKFGVCLGIGIGGISTISQAAVSMGKKGVKRISPFLIPQAISNQAAAWLSMEWNLQGQIGAVVNACSSGGDAVGFSFRSIRDGYADYMLTGGAESCINPLSIGAFGNMRALSSWKGDPKKSL